MRDRWSSFACIALLLAAGAGAATIDEQLRAAQELEGQKRFAEAERIYRQVLARAPHEHAAILGLGQVLLWESRFAEAREVYRRALRDVPTDRRARKGLATAEYWDGDFRSALRDYGVVDDADARKAIAEIRAASAPLAVADTSFSSDDQPLRRATASASYTFFSDPLTKWTATAGAYAFHPRAQSPFASIAGSTAFPWQHLRATASLRFLRFPDGRSAPLGGAGIAREWPHASLGFDVDRHEILYTVTSLDNHPSETTATLAWNRSTGASSSAAALHATRYFDANHGRAADAYHLVRVAGPLSIGAAASYRDTDESRFNGTAYDPYWTPQHLTDVRAVAAAAVGRIRLHLDGGWAQDRLNGAFRPWRASAELALPFNATLAVERQSTVFYRATSFRLTIVSRVDRR